MGRVIDLDLTADPVELTGRLIDIPSPSHEEKEIADAIESALRTAISAAGAGSGAEVARIHNTVLARTNRGLPSRVILAGHIDTVPIADNVPHTLAGGVLHGCGSVDMKSGLACYLHAFATLVNSPRLARDMTVIAYEAEEVASRFNGLGIVEREAPGWLEGDVALLGEPSGATIEAGCQGTIRQIITARGTRAHSARAWLGDNAAHKLAGVLERISAYEPRRVTIDGCEYREGLNVVGLRAGVATNTLPDEAVLTVNFRFAPDRSTDEALTHLAEVLGAEADGLDVVNDDVSDAAAPGLTQPAAAELVAATGGNVRAKFGWTDVARFAKLGIPAVNYGPGDPGFAHKKDEQCEVADIEKVAEVLERYLTAE